MIIRTMWYNHPWENRNGGTDVAKKMRIKCSWHPPWPKWCWVQSFQWPLRQYIYIRNMVLYLANPYTYTPLFMLGGLTKSGYWYWSSTIPKLESWESASKMGTQQKPSCVIKLGQFIIYRVLTLHLVQKNLPFIDWKTYHISFNCFLLKIKNYRVNIG